jgi:hypothetical protein
MIPRFTDPALVLTLFTLAGAACGPCATGCSLSAAWSSPSQQQVTNPTAPVGQTVTTESPQTAGPSSAPAGLPKPFPAP